MLHSNLLKAGIIGALCLLGFHIPVIAQEQAHTTLYPGSMCFASQASYTLVARDYYRREGKAYNYSTEDPLILECPVPRSSFDNSLVVVAVLLIDDNDEEDISCSLIARDQKADQRIFGQQLKTSSAQPEPRLLKFGPANIQSNAVYFIRCMLPAREEDREIPQVLELSVTEQ